MLTGAHQQRAVVDRNHHTSLATLTPRAAIAARATDRLPAVLSRRDGRSIGSLQQHLFAAELQQARSMKMLQNVSGGCLGCATACAALNRPVGDHHAAHTCARRS